MDKLVTVIIQTSPLPSHPSTALLEALFRSFDRVHCLKDCRVIILCDGCDEELRLSDQVEPGSVQTAVVENEKKKPQNKTNYKHGSFSREAANNYLLHLKLLEEKIKNQEPPFTSSNNGTIHLLKLPHRHGSAKAIVAAFEILSIATPYVLIAQHDNFFVRDVHYLQDLIGYMERAEVKSWLQCCHFPSTATLNYVEKVRRRYDLNLEQFCNQPQNMPICGQFIPLVFWYGKTHLARTSYYSEMIIREFSPKVGDHFEELFGKKQLHEIMNLKKSSLCNKEGDKFEVLFPKLHVKYGNYVFFHSNGDKREQEVLYHLSGRKVCATNAISVKPVYSKDATGDMSENATFNPQQKSFTTAKRVMALVPGLEIKSENFKESRTLQDGVTAPKFKSKFRQRCFHCGEKGHSFRFCPRINKDQDCIPCIKILDL